MVTFKRRFLAAVIAVLTVMSCFAGLSFSVGAETGRNFAYTVRYDGTVSITRYNGSAKDVVIPVKIDGKKVTSIGEYAFESCESLTDITIPDGVTEIGFYAFGSCKLLKKISIPASLTRIGDSAFESCVSLTDINIPDGVTYIGEYAFHDCESLKNISIPASVTSISRSTFDCCESLTNISIPASVTSIGDFAFGSCKSLINISIPASVKIIGDSAFSGCESLTNISIPANVTSIGGYAFAGCIGLASITVDKNNAFYKSEDGVLFNKDMTQIISYPNKHGSKYTIPGSVETIGEGTFWGCNELTSITIPDRVETIGVYAFRDCTGLTSITIPDRVETIGDCAFWGCTGLTSVTIPDRVETIGVYAFQACTRLTNVIISDSVTHIFFAAFENCYNLKSILIPKNVSFLDDCVFGYTFNDNFDRDKIANFIIYGYSNTVAEEYAKENGFKFVDISSCKHTKTELKNKVDVTCTKAGYSGDEYCKNCTMLIKNGVKIPATGHKFNKGVCTVCGAIESDYKVVFNSTSKQIKVDNKSKVVIFTPASNSGMKVSEFKKQFNSEINVSLNNNALVANGVKFKFGGSEFTVIVKGDVNGDGKISALDARTILRISAKLDKADDITLSAADVNDDGKVTASEARRVLRFSAKLEKTING